MKYQQFDTKEMRPGWINKTWKNDCTVRSLSLVLDHSYEKVFRDLMQFGLEMGDYTDHDKVWQAYAEDQGLVKNKPPRDSRGKLIKLKDWDYQGKAAVINSGHLTAVDGGYLIDTWDCRYRPVNSYWERVTG